MKVVLKEGAIFKKGVDTDAGYDMVNCSGKDVHVHVGATVKIPLGVSIELPPNTTGILTHRSSLSWRKDTILSLGIIDESFNGGFMQAKIYNLGREPFTIKKGERFCQLIIVPIICPELNIVSEEELKEGKEGFGSSGEM